MQTVNLFVTGLGTATNEEQLRQLFEKFGKVESTKIMLDSRTGASRGFGFVLFSHREEGMKALESLNGTPFGSGTLHITLSQHDGRAEQRTRLYVRNIPSTVNNAMVNEYFSTFGTVVSMNLRPDTSGYAGGPVRSQQASVEFNDANVAERALKATHGKTPFAGAAGPILAKFAESSHFRANRRAKKDNNSTTPKNHHHNHVANNNSPSHSHNSSGTATPNPVFINPTQVVPITISQGPLILGGFPEFVNNQNHSYAGSPTAPQPLLKLAPTGPLLFPNPAEQVAEPTPFVPPPAFMVISQTDFAAMTAPRVRASS